MAKKTLQEVFKCVRTLSSGIQVSNSLIQDMEVVGYLNSASVDTLLQLNFSPFNMGGVINHSVDKQLICSNYLYQVKEDESNGNPAYRGKLYPIFKQIKMATTEMNIPLNQMDIPSLRMNCLYRKIKERVGTDVVVSEYELRKSKMPDYIHLENGKLMYHIIADDVLCYDRHEMCRSVGDDILVLCRYVHVSTGNVCYAQFELTDVYTEFKPLNIPM